MQEEVNDKTIALSVKTAKLTGTVLKAVLRKFLEEQAKAKQKAKTKSAEPKHGKQTMKQLMKQNTQLTGIEVTDGNIKSFEKVARKYGIDFSLKKDASENPPKYIIFFKAKEIDVMTAAFKEYTKNDLKKRISRPCGKDLQKLLKLSASTEKRSSKKARIGGSRADEIRYKEISAAELPVLFYLLFCRQDRVAVQALFGRYAV